MYINDKQFLLMNMFNLKKIVWPAIASLLIGISLLILIPVGLAEEEEFTVETLCREKVLPVLQEEYKLLETWMEQHFLNASSNRELLTQAVQRLKQFERKTFAHFNEVFVIPPGETSVDAAKAYERCSDILFDAQSQTRDILKSSVVSNTQVKKNIQIIQKYKAINSKLKALNNEMGFLQGYLNQLNSKVPCYLQQCVR